MKAELALRPALRGATQLISGDTQKRRQPEHQPPTPGQLACLAAVHPAQASFPTRQGASRDAEISRGVLVREPPATHEDGELRPRQGRPLVLWDTLDSGGISITIHGTYTNS